MTEAKLEASTDMTPVEGSVELSIPISELWTYFTQPREWPGWNPCMAWVHNRDLVVGKRLIWIFQPIRRRYLYKFPAVARIVEREENARVTWEVSAVPGFYARHTYWMAPDGDNTRFGSWEKAMGPTFRLMRRFWVAHFEFVCASSIAGAKHLDDEYRRTGSLPAPPPDS
jgi:hypothetical protein